MSSSAARPVTSGSANGRPSRSARASRCPATAKLVSSQPQYSMIWRAPEAEVFQLCAEDVISQIVWSPLAQGVLTGKYEPGETAARRLSRRSDEMGGAIDRSDDEILEAVQRLRPDRRRRRPHDAVQLALAWVLRRDEVASAIIGASRPEQVHQNAAASGVELSDDVLDGDRRRARRHRRHRTALRERAGRRAPVRDGHPAAGAALTEHGVVAAARSPSAKPGRPSAGR